MKPPVRMAAVAGALVVTLALAGASRASLGGSTAPNPRNCAFVRNHLPCPCPSAQKARTLARAAQVTTRALGRAFASTAAALGRAESTPPPAGNAAPR